MPESVPDHTPSLLRRILSPANIFVGALLTYAVGITGVAGKFDHDRFAVLDHLLDQYNASFDECIDGLDEAHDKSETLREALVQSQQSEMEALGEKMRLLREYEVLLQQQKRLLKEQAVVLKHDTGAQKQIAALLKQHLETVRRVLSQPCTEAQTQQIHDADLFATTHVDLIAPVTSRFCATHPEYRCPEIDFSVLLPKVGQATAYCPSPANFASLGQGDEGGEVVLRLGDDPAFPHGAYAISSAVFADYCEVVNTVAHEEAGHILSGFVHELDPLTGKEKTNDIAYVLGETAAAACRSEEESAQ